MPRSSDASLKLGNSSSLFEEETTSKSTRFYSPEPDHPIIVRTEHAHNQIASRRPATATRTPRKLATTPRSSLKDSSMVNQREPHTPGRPTSRSGPLYDTSANPKMPSSSSVEYVRDTQHTADKQKPTERSLQEVKQSTPEFGKTSQIRNALKEDDNRNSVFNIPKPGKPRPEHHKSEVRQAFRMPPGYSKAPEATSIHPARPDDIQPPPRPIYSSQQFGSGQRSNSYSSGAATVAGSNYIDLTRPERPIYDIQPALRPMFSSQQMGSGYQTLAPNARTASQFIDLTKKGDEFDPDAALRDIPFGAPDAYSYVESGQAQENIKALLEGAFDDEDDKHKLRPRKKKSQSKEADGPKSLADKLQALEVKEEQQKEPEPDDEDDEDDGTVKGLNVKLLPHQVDGVAWMTNKEVGTKKKNGVLPKGGILADDMGLGKTIQSIALILANPRPSLAEAAKETKNKISEKTSKCTLVVAPLALIKQWETEIKSKVEKSHSLRVLMHHGPSRAKRGDELKKYDVVITTYQIVASEHAGSSEQPDGPKVGCFGVNWYRIILDEAHSIKNRNAKSTKACYALKSHYRWCLTGTPMQNNLDELQSLICFLRIKPYCEFGPWKEHITGPMKNGRGNLAMKRLQYFLQAFMKRRTKDILKKEGALNPGGKVDANGESKGFKIVERKIEHVVAQFSEQERKFYDRLSQRAQESLDIMMGGAKADYIGALVLLLRLRQACNHPELIKDALANDKDALNTGSSVQSGSQTPRRPKATNNDVDDIANLLGGLTVETKHCDVCQIELHLSESSKGATRCTDCEENLASQKKTRKHRKHKKSKQEDEEDEELPVYQPKLFKSQRNRRVISDSDDEEEEGAWVVPKSQQHDSDLGKAGDTDEENADGPGEWVRSDDSESGNESDSLAIITNPSKKAISLDSEDQDPSEYDSSEDEDDSDGSTSSTSSASLPFATSTKITRLIQILEDETSHHKVIVFSQFTSTLDLIEPFLDAFDFTFARYDGSMRNDAREASLTALRTDPDTRILLCSLKCGSLGLNLTAASRVVLMEPFWNPFVEEQAIDRVHRLNQTVDVKVYRLTIADTVEERILDLQEAKRKLAAAALEGGKAAGKLTLQDILKLFSRGAEHDDEHRDDRRERHWKEGPSAMEMAGRAWGSGRNEVRQLMDGGARVPGKDKQKREEHAVWGRR